MLRALPVKPAVVLTGGNSRPTSTLWPATGWPVEAGPAQVTSMTDWLVLPNTRPAKYWSGPTEMAGATGRAAAEAAGAARTANDAAASGTNERLSFPSM